jgi:hypothetical protein
MKLKRIFTLTIAVFGLLSISIAVVVSAASTVVVTPGSLNGWEISNYDVTTDTAGTTPTASGTTGFFAQGPGTPPAGSGSFHQVMGTNGDDAQRIRTANFNGTLLSNLTQLSYSTYVSNNSDGQATYIQLFVDTTGDGNADDILFFEPVYQNGLYSTLPYSSTVPNQCGLNPLCVTLGTWQRWDAAAGGWWSGNESAGGPPLTTLASYAAQHPGAALANNSNAFRLTVGFGAPTWNNFSGAVDKVTVNGTTFDFERYNAPTFAGQCKNGGWQTFSPNRPAGPFKNQGDCIQYVNTGK